MDKDNQLAQAATESFGELFLTTEGVYETVMRNKLGTSMLFIR